MKLVCVLLTQPRSRLLLALQSSGCIPSQQGWESPLLPWGLGNLLAGHQLSTQSSPARVMWELPMEAKGDLRGTSLAFLPQLFPTWTCSSAISNWTWKQLGLCHVKAGVPLRDLKSSQCVSREVRKTQRGSGKPLNISEGQGGD